MADAHSPFHDLNDYVAIPRMTGLRLSPDGSWLAATVQSLSPDKKKYVASIWRIDAAGGPPARLTRSADGEGSPRFLPDGTLLFVSKRADPDAADGEDSAAASAGSSSLSLRSANAARPIFALSTSERYR